jgi:SAM-dependent methyltransferase
MAFAIRTLLGLPMQGKFRFDPDFSIYNVESNGALHRELSEHESYVCSEYFGSAQSPGQRVRGVLHQDLQRLSFEDRSFDLVLSSDVLEHVPEPYLAHRQILRVLKQGGRHLFTVPYNPGSGTDDVRAREVNGKVEYMAEKLYHGDPVRPKQGILVWTIFGREMQARLQEIGFQVQVLTIDRPDLGIVGDSAIVFDAMKPPAA